MSVRITVFATTLILSAFLGTKGFAQDLAPVDPAQGTTAPQGHTLDELGRGIKDEAKKVGKKLGRIGKDIKVEAIQISSSVAQKFEDAKSDVQKLPLQHRIYARIHWDKVLHSARIEVHLLKDGVVLLRGTVPNEAARHHALDLASASFGVNAVIDELKLPNKSTASQAAVVTPKSSTR